MPTLPTACARHRRRRRPSEIVCREAGSGQPKSPQAMCQTSRAREAGGRSAGIAASKCQTSRARETGSGQPKSPQAMCQTSRAREAGSGSAGIAASNVSDLTCPGNWGRTAGNAASNTPGACARKLTRTGICVPQLAPGDPVEGMWDRECWGPAGGCAAERAAFLRLKMLPRSAAWQDGIARCGRNFKPVSWEEPAARCL